MAKNFQTAAAPKSENFDAVIFDCFGVLVGSATPVLRREFSDEVLNEYARLCVPADNDELSYAEFLSALGAATGQTADDWRRLFQRANGLLPTVDYARDLRRRGLKTAILSNCARGRMADLFGEKLNTHFDLTLESAAVELRKPDPRIYRLTLKKLDVRPERAIFIDDHQENLTPAHALGMATVLFKNFAQAKAEIEKLLGWQNSKSGLDA